MATIYDVAAIAGVSPATVSRVMNGANVSAEKRALVLAAASTLKFTPNRSARRLRNQSSELIALLIPDIENPFYTALARGVEDRARQSGYSVVLCNTDDDATKETKYLDIVVSEDMAGVILAPASFDGDLHHVVSQARPVVSVDRTTEFDIDAVMVDNRAAGVLATKALLEAGYARVACIAGPENDERAAGWRRAVSLGGGESLQYLRHANYRVDGGRNAMRALLDLEIPPDAVVATNNLMGVGVIQALSERGIAPPTFGVSIIGELPFNTLPPQSITQIRLPARHLGVTAASMLMDRITGDTQPSRTVVVRAELAG